jgi:hypothetical protein
MFRSISAFQQRRPASLTALTKKLLSDRHITDGQRDVIGKMLADEEAKLLNLFDPPGQEQTSRTNS